MPWLNLINFPFILSDYIKSATEFTRNAQNRLHQRNRCYLRRMNQRRNPSKFLSWLQTLGSSNPRIKENMIRILNDRYRDFLSFGKIAEFYDCGLHKSSDLDTFLKINRRMTTFKCKWSQRGKVHIIIHKDFTFNSHDNTTTERKITQIESILKFEHTIRTLQLKVCKSCHKYKLQFDDSLIVDNERGNDMALKIITQNQQKWWCVRNAKEKVV